MFERNRVPRYPRQVWFVVAMALVLIGLVVRIALDGRLRSTQEAMAPTAVGKTIVLTATETPIPTARPTDPAPTMAPTADLDSTTPINTITKAPTDTPFPTASETATPEPSATPTETAEPTPTVPDDHYWLERPIAVDHNDRVARFYPYASRLDGSYPIHHGVEFVNPMKTPIRATANGIIVAAGDDSQQVYGARSNFYGLVVIQELDQTLNDQPIFVLYGHLSEIAVEEGQRVAAGETIGLVGMSGVAEGPHLHMEVRYGHNDYVSTVNPELWVKPRQGFGSLAGRVTAPDGEAVAEAKVVLYAAPNLDDPVRDVFTYPHSEVNPDPVWQESFGTGDLAAGEWVAKLYYKQRLYVERVLIQEGRTTWLEIQTEA